MYKIKILGVTYAFPPMAFPQSIQISRLLASLDVSIVVICGSDSSARNDETIAPNIEQHFEHIIRIPFYRPKILRYTDEILYRCYLSWTIPDVYKIWVSKALKYFFKWQKEVGYKPDLIMTFGMPMSDHLFGLRFKKLTEIPWIAHFSDPWVDSLFNHYHPLTKWLNKCMEYQVICKADALIFTSPETIKMVMRKYPPSWVNKSFYVPHSYDQMLFPPENKPPEGIYIMRSIGGLFEPRSPEPFLKALEIIKSENSSLLKDVLVEFVGPLFRKYRDLPSNYPSIKQYINFKGSVSYAESLYLMQTAHCLIVINAPERLSVFFPSKLVEYIGANRFIFAISPPGTTARMINNLGGLVADPLDIPAITHCLRRILKERPCKLSTSNSQYDKNIVGRRMMEIIEMVINNSIS